MERNVIELSEKQVQSKIMNDAVVKNGVFTALNINGSVGNYLIPEDEYINGITADFTLVSGNNIEAIIECKSGSINVTDYVRGIGQLFQYEYFYENNVKHKSYDYSKKFHSVFFFPSSVLRNNSFNISRFKYPKSVILLELNEYNNFVRRITDEDLASLKEISENENLTAISHYYFRDNRLFEYYILLKYLMQREEKGESCDRKTVENSLKKTDTINNGNWRNAFITMSNLGLIDKMNRPTISGKRLAIEDYPEFACELYYSYIHPYAEELCGLFEDSDKSKNMSNSEICERIRSKYGNKDVLYLTQSDGRYVSSWMNILRDDYGIFEFKSKSSIRKMLYNPKELKKEAFKRRIEDSGIAQRYIAKYRALLKEGQI